MREDQTKKYHTLALNVHNTMTNKFFYDVFHRKLKTKSTFATSLHTFRNNYTINDVLVSHSNKETQHIHSNLLLEINFLVI